MPALRYLGPGLLGMRPVWFLQRDEGYELEPLTSPTTGKVQTSDVNSIILFNLFLLSLPIKI